MQNVTIPAWLLALLPFIGTLIGSFTSFLNSHFQIRTKEQQEANDWLFEYYITEGFERTLSYIDVLIARLNISIVTLEPFEISPPPAEAIHRVETILGSRCLQYFIQSTLIHQHVFMGSQTAKLLGKQQSELQSMLLDAKQTMPTEILENEYPKWKETAQRSATLDHIKIATMKANQRALSDLSHLLSNISREISGIRIKRKADVAKIRQRSFIRNARQETLEIFEHFVTECTKNGFELQSTQFKPHSDDTEPLAEG